MRRIFLIYILFLFPSIYCQTADNDVSAYNVTWTSISKDHTGSMPTGNGDIGLNVWVEKSGDVLFLIGKTDAYDENSTLLKLGRIKLKFSPSPFEKDTTFTQTLHLNQSEIVIKEGNSLEIRLWVDANNPVINVETNSRQKYTQEVILETWRDSIYQISTEVSDMFKNLYGPDPYSTLVYPDINEKTNSSIISYHLNRKPDNDGYEINLKLQGLDSAMHSYKHPLLNRIFGILMEGENFTPVNEKKLISKSPAGSFSFSIYALTLHPSDPDNWKKEISGIANAYKKLNKDELLLKHRNWWKEFWNRSFIKITSSDDNSDSTAYMVSRAYNLCRYMNACGGRGNLPIKFNGSIFSYGTKENPDYRRWGGPGFWFQNVRLAYYPMLEQGDFDLMQPWLDMYSNMLPLQKDRTKRFFNHDGAIFPETATFWGSEVSGHYGWTPFEKRKNPLAECTYLTYYWQNSIEQVLMMYNYYEYTGDTDFAREVLMPHADAVSRFYEVHYQLDNRGKFHFGPAQSLETYHIAVNPLPEIAGLKYTLTKLLSLKEPFVTEELSTRWKYILDHLPPLPLAEKDGEKYLLPALLWDMKMNMENPELYAVHPYRIYGFGKPEIETGRNTFDRRLHKLDYCWNQNAVDAALLGLTDTAKNFVVNRTTPQNYSDSRFPAMWNAFNDWIPDIDHGGNLQMALHYMLLQCEGEEIRLFPSWPKEWNVEFRLHAPYQTTIEGKMINGVVKDIKVFPEERRKDIVW